MTAKKKKDRLVLYQRMLFFISLSVFMVATMYFVTLIPRIGIENPIVAIIFFVLRYVVIFILAIATTIYGVYKGWDKKLYLYFYYRDHEKYLKRKEKVKKKIETIRNAYAIKRACATNVPYQFDLKFDEKLFRDVRPDIWADGQRLPLLETKKHWQTVNAESIITANKREIVFSTARDKQFILQNPFYCDFTDAKIKWQCEGHSNERIIYIDCNTMDHGFLDVTQYPFVVSINGRTPKKAIGIYKNGTMAIPIPNIRKSHCNGRRVKIAPEWSKDMKIELPRPIVMIRNGRPVES